MSKSILELIGGLNQKELEDLYGSMGDYEEPLVTIEEFINSPKFLGSYFDGGFWPYWLPVLKEIYPSPYYNPHFLVCLRGSIGRGKTICACTGIAYDIYRLLSLNHPQQFYKLLPSTKITIAIFNVTLGLANDVVWDQLEAMLSASPWFKERVDIAAQRKKKKEDDTIFPKRIDIFIGSRVGHSLGRAIFCGILSEASFDVLTDQTIKSFNSLLARGQSRFLEANSPFKLWIDSSEGDKSSAINKIADMYRNKPGVYINQGPTWEPKLHLKDKYSGNMFKIYKGSDSVQPRVLNTPNNLDDESDAVFQHDPGNIMEVPVEHFDRFDADIHMALRDLAGIATTSKYKLIRHKDRLHKSCQMMQIMPDIITLDFDADDDQISNYALIPAYFNNPLYPNTTRYIHIDIGLTGDRLGIASGFISGFKEKTITDIATLQKTTELAPEFLIEWCFAIQAKSGQQIPLYKVRLFIKWLMDRGVMIEKVSCDGFESADMLQMLNKMGISTEETSMDRTPLPYLTYRTVINEDRIKQPPSKLLIDEVEDLEISPDGKRVDHPTTPTASKDVSDAVCGVVWQANKYSQNYMLMHMILDDGSQEAKKDLKNMFWGDQ